MGVCDVPVISTVCDTAGEAAATSGVGAVRLARPRDGRTPPGGCSRPSGRCSTPPRSSTSPARSTSSVYNLLFGIAVFVMLIFFCLQLITGLIRRDPTALSRAALGLAKSVLGTFVVITLTALLLEIIDQLCIGIVQATGDTIESMGDKIALLAAGLVGDQHRRPRRRRDHHDLPRRPRDRRRRDRVVLPADPQGAAAGGDRVRTHRPLRGVVGCHPGLVRQVGDVRHRTDLSPSSCSS